MSGGAVKALSSIPWTSGGGGGGGGGGYSLVGLNANNSGYSSSTTLTVPITTASTSGHKLVLTLGLNWAANAGGTITAASDSQGNTWDVDTNGGDPDNATGTAIASSVTTTGLGTSDHVSVTFSTSPDGGYVSWTVSEWEGFTSGLADKVGAGDVGSGLGCSAELSASTTAATDLLVTTLFSNQGLGTVTPPAGWTSLGNLYYLIATSESRYNPAFSWTDYADASQAVAAYLP